MKAVRRWLFNWLEIFGGECKPIRRYLGGRWERWWCEPCNAWLWLRNEPGLRPGGCFGMVDVEEYGPARHPDTARIFSRSAPTPREERNTINPDRTVNRIGL